MLCKDVKVRVQVTSKLNLTSKLAVIAIFSTTGASYSMVYTEGISGLRFLCENEQPKTPFGWHSRLSLNVGVIFYIIMLAFNR